MGAATMSKKPKRSYDNTARQQENIAGDCNCCKELLAKAVPPRQQKTKVYAKHGTTRYCVCINCGHTWKKVVLIEHKC